jgi:integrase
MANVTFENCCTNFLTEVRRTRTVSTADTYKYRLTGVLQEFGGKTLREITQEEIQAFFDNNMKGYATKTVRSTFDVLCAIFRQAQRRGIIDSNPCDKVIIPEVVRHQPCVLSKKEVEDVLSKANEEGEEMYLPLLIVAETGIRRSQALALCWQDIDFDSCKITVARNVINHRKNIFSEGKERRTRTIFMSPRFVVVKRFCNTCG